DLKEKMDAISKTNENLVSKLAEAEEALKTQSAEIKKLREAGTADILEKPVSFKQALKNAFMEQKDKILHEKNDDYGKRLSLKKFFEDHGSMAKTPQMTIKAPVDMFLGNII